MNLEEIWKITLAQIEVKLDSPAQFKTWFKDTKLLNINGKNADVGVKNSYASEWLYKKHHKMIKSTISYVFGQELEPKYVIDKSISNKPQPKITTDDILKDSPILGYKENLVSSDLSASIKKSNLNENFSFETFVVGGSNKLAHAAAIGVSQKSGQIYNPLFIYGRTGLGKTHLGQAIARAILEKDPGKKITYIPSEGFLNDMVKAIRNGKNLEFRQKYRSLDLLILDDIQLISKWVETQNEFFNTFNVLHNDKKQVILISDRRPEEIAGIEARLRSRFQGGLIVDIGKPDYEMRLAIVTKKAKHLSITLPEKVYEFIARLISDNVRELEGALQKISLYQSMFGAEITMDEIARILGKDKKSQREKVKVPQVIKKVAKEFKLTVKELKSSRRTTDVAFPRQVCMYLLREEFGHKLEDVAKFLERKDHTTVMHAVDKVKSKMMIEEAFKNQVEGIKDDILQAE